jgi:hypothetical protein
MTEDTGRSVHANAMNMQDIEVPDAEQEQIFAIAKQNADRVSRLAIRIAFEDEPSLYADAIEKARG